MSKKKATRETKPKFKPKPKPKPKPKQGGGRGGTIRKAAPRGR